MYIIDENGKLHEGERITEAEADFLNEFPSAVTRETSVYVRTDIAQAVATYIVRKYNITPRTAPAPEEVPDPLYLPAPLPAPVVDQADEL